MHQDGGEANCGVNYRNRARSRNGCPESGYVTVETLATTEGVVPRGTASPGHKGPPPLTSNDPSLALKEVGAERHNTRGGTGQEASVLEEDTLG